MWIKLTCSQILVPCPSKSIKLYYKTLLERNVLQEFSFWFVKHELHWIPVYTVTYDIIL